MDYSIILEDSPIYERFGAISAEELLEHFPFGKPENTPRKREYFGHMVKLTAERYRVYAEKGLQCPACGLTGIVFILERSKSQNTKKCHWNLYGIKNGRLVMMTIDHIIPKSKGGLDIIENKQPMCIICNNKKGNNTN
jgi:hypothetical protein